MGAILGKARYGLSAGMMLMPLARYLRGQLKGTGPAGSNYKCDGTAGEVLGENLSGSSIAESLARTIIELRADGRHCAVAFSGQIRSLGPILSYQAVGVFVAASLPGTVGLGEVDLRVEGFAEMFMLREFLAVVKRSRATQRTRQPRMMEITSNNASHQSRVGIWLFSSGARLWMVCNAPSKLDG